MLGLVRLPAMGVDSSCQKLPWLSIHGGRPADGTRRPASVTTYERDKDENCDAHAGIVHTAY